MLIKNIDKRIRMATVVSTFCLVAMVVVVAMALMYSHKSAMIERKKIYILDGTTPLMASQTDMDLNLEIEAKNHIEVFHQLFFTLPPDEKYISRNIEKAMYLADESALKQYNTLKEKGFYNSIMSSSAILTIMTDSIVMDMNSMKFHYYGVQRIERPSSVLRRLLVTTGEIQKSIRTDNNPHGLLIVNWRTELNKDIDYKTKQKL